jgi:CPA2 family monovalent cation:H+ antiporter-2
VLELNIDTVRDMKKHGEPIYYGDATKREVLNHLGIKTASILVVVISDPVSCRNVVRTARFMNPELYIIARTRYTVEVDDLLKLGANDVIPEEFETSVEIFSKVLGRYQTPKNIIFNFIDKIRKDGYKALRQTETDSQLPLFDKYSVLSSIAVESVTISGNTPVIGKSIEDLRFRTKTGATIIAIERNSQMHTSPSPKFSFNTDDIVFITGQKEDINKAIVYLTEGEVNNEL